MKSTQVKIIIGVTLLFLGLFGYFFSTIEKENSPAFNNENFTKKESEKQLLTYKKEYTLNKDLQVKIKELDILLASTEKELLAFQQKNTKHKNLNKQTNMNEIAQLKRDIENVKKTITSMNKNLK